MNRYTVEYSRESHGWVVIDENAGWCGSVVMAELTESSARDIAKFWNESEKFKRENPEIAEAISNMCVSSLPSGTPTG